MHNNIEIFQEWLANNNKVLPAVTSEKVPADRKAEYDDIIVLATEFNSANIRSHKEFKLGELSLNVMFGPAVAETILQGVEAAATQNSALARLIKHMGPGADGIDIGNPYATVLLDQLQSLEVFTPEQRDTIDENRTEHVTISDSEAWNCIHTR